MRYDIGVIESNDDPMGLGRCRVRIFGIHTEDKTQLPTDMLPWATLLAPNLGMSSAAGLLPGSWVLIDYYDNHKQMPIMMGGVGNLPSYDQPCSDIAGVDGSADSTYNISNAPSDLPPLAKAVTHGEASSYDAWYGHGSGAPLPGLGKKPTECTIQEIMSNAPARVAAAGGSAVGIYQWIPKTFTTIVQKCGMSLSEKFTPEVQNLLFLKGYCSVGGMRPPIGRYLKGDKNDQSALSSAMQACAMEWASVEWSVNCVGTGDIYSAYKKNNKLGTKADVVKQGLLDQWDASNKK